MSNIHKNIAILVLLASSISLVNSGLIKANQTAKRPRIQQKVDTGSNTNNTNTQPKSEIKQAPKIDPNFKFLTFSKLSDMERWIYAAFWTIIGLPLCFYGKKYWCLFGPLLGAITGIFIGNFIEAQLSNLVYSNKPGVSDTWSWVFMVGTIVIAGILAIIFACAKTIVGILIGAAQGFFGTNLVMSAITNMNDGVALIWWAQWIIMALIVALGVVIGCCIADLMILIGCCVIGAWTFTCGIGSFIGQFPYNYNKNPLPAWVFWAYFAGFCILAVLGFIVQCKEKQKQDLEAKNGGAVY